MSLVALNKQKKRREQLDKYTEKDVKLVEREAEVRIAEAEQRRESDWLKSVGSRAQVMHGTAYKTDKGVTKVNLKYNKNGRIVSKTKSAKGPALLKQLRDAGYTTQKGKFGMVRNLEKPGEIRRKTRKERRRKGNGRKKGRYKPSVGNHIKQIPSEYIPMFGGGGQKRYRKKRTKKKSRKKKRKTLKKKRTKKRSL